ncbi:putative AGC protein kinase [Paratrimastix pyriformis]|uniref:AGC protein kinase n=1 Tax=Paratrimastix pyriformis TaxID=342808 RepID=A0ABQ8U8F0_9EUKA|nr:putative AGC protein kinase [Paratrimastix pyriformis]
MLAPLQILLSEDAPPTSFDDTIQMLLVSLGRAQDTFSSEIYEKMEALTIRALFSDQWTQPRKGRFFEILLAFINHPSFNPTEANLHLRKTEFISGLIRYLAQTIVLPPPQSAVGAIMRSAGMKPPTSSGDSAALTPETTRDLLVRILHRIYSLMLPWRAYMRDILQGIFVSVATQPRSRPGMLFNPVTVFATTAVPVQPRNQRKHPIFDAPSASPPKAIRTPPPHTPTPPPHTPSPVGSLRPPRPPSRPGQPMRAFPLPPKSPTPKSPSPVPGVESTPATATEAFIPPVLTTPVPQSGPGAIATPVPVALAPPAGRHHPRGNGDLSTNSQPNYDQGVAPLLRLYAAITAGFRMPLQHAHRLFLRDALLPLYQPSAFFDDMVPVLSLYDRDLSRCLVEYLKKEPELGGPVIDYLLDAWPDTANANSAKEALLLNQLETVIGLTPPEVLQTRVQEVFTRIASCSASLNFRVAERALTLWNNEVFVNRASHFRAEVLPLMFPALVHDGGKLHWNVTVNRLYLAALTHCRQIDEGLFTQCAAEFWAKKDPILTPPLAAERTAEYMALLQGTVDKENQKQQAQRAAASSLAVTTVRLLESGGRPLGHLDFVFGAELGRGSYAAVREATLIDRDREQSAWVKFALKVIDKGLVESAHCAEEISREIATLNRLKHPNIIRLISTFEDHRHLYLVLEHMPGGDLYTALHKAGRFQSGPAVQWILAEVILALTHVHAQGMVYNDLKPEGHIRLTDFGSCLPIPTGPDDVVAPPAPGTIKGTADYIAPEVLAGHPPRPTADMWALGCLVFYLFAGHLPFYAESQEALFATIRGFRGPSGGLDAPSSDPHAFGFPREFPAAARELVERLLQPEPAARPCSLAAFQEHPFFAGLDWAALSSGMPPLLVTAQLGGAGGGRPAVPQQHTQRRFSMMYAPIQGQYAATGDVGGLPAIPEMDESGTAGPSG